MSKWIITFELTWFTMGSNRIVLKKIFSFKILVELNQAHLTHQLLKKNSYLLLIII